MQMHPKYAIPLICWDMLGFYRGVESYDDGRATYGHGKYKYWDSFVCVIGGAFVYSIPPLTLFAIYNEVRKLECKIRKIK